jgi:hypothetical protein
MTDKDWRNKNPLVHSFKQCLGGTITLPNQKGDLIKKDSVAPEGDFHN